MLSGNAMRILWTFEPLSDTQHSKKNNKTSGKKSIFSLFLNQLAKEPEKQLSVEEPKKVRELSETNDVKPKNVT